MQGIDSPQNNKESWLDLKSIKEVIRISTTKGGAPAKFNEPLSDEDERSSEQHSQSSQSPQENDASLSNNTLRQYLRFNNESARQSQPPRHHLQLEIDYSGSSNGIIDRVAIDGFAPSAFQVESQNHIDTPINSIAQHHMQSLANLLKFQTNDIASEMNEQQQQPNQFKRRQSSVIQEREASKSIYQKMQTPQNKEQLFPQTASHKRKQSQLIDLTNKIDKNQVTSQDKGSTFRSHLRLQILDEEQSATKKMPPLQLPTSDDKENHNPYKSRRQNAFSSISFQKENAQNCFSQPPLVPNSARAQKNQSSSIPLLQLDEELKKFNERVNKLKRQFNTCSNGGPAPSTATGPYEQSPEQKLQQPFEVSSHSSRSQQISLQASDIKSYLSEALEDQEEESQQTFEQIDVNPYRSITIQDNQSFQAHEKPSFKRTHSQQTNIIESQTTDNILQLKKDNLRLQRELEAEKQLYQQQIDSQYNTLIFNFEVQIKSRDEEHAIILDGVKAEYEEQLSILRSQINEERMYYETQLIEQHNLRQIMELQHQKIVDEYEKRVATTQSRNNKQTLSKGAAQCLSMREFVRYQMSDDLQEREREEILMKPEIISNNLSPFSQINHQNISASRPPKTLITMSKRKEQAMNFSFSEVNRTASAEKKEAELFHFQNSQRKLQANDETNNQENLSERVSPVKQHVAPSNQQSRYHSLRDYLEQPQQPDPQFMLMNPSSEFMSPEGFKSQKMGSQTTTNRKTRFFQSLEQEHFQNNQLQPFNIQQCENLEVSGHESGFVSDDIDYQERIVNESSLENDEEHTSEDEYRDQCDIKFNLVLQNTDRFVSQKQLMMMTGKSESQIEEDFDEDPATSKPIHSSCINFKRNNLLPNLTSLENTKKRVVIKHH